MPPLPEEESPPSSPRAHSTPFARDDSSESLVSFPPGPPEPDDSADLSDPLGALSGALESELEIQVVPRTMRFGSAAVVELGLGAALGEALVGKRADPWARRAEPMGVAGTGGEGGDGEEGVAKEGVVEVPAEGQIPLGGTLPRRKISATLLPPNPDTKRREGVQPFDEPDSSMAGMPRSGSDKKHLFILTSAGKPVYSRYGDESKLSTYMGIVQALISFFSSDDDSLRSIHAGAHKFVFAMKGPLYLLTISSTGESEAQLRDQMNYMYSQILFILTSAQLTRIFETRVNYDLRNLLTGTEMFLDHLSGAFQTSVGYFLGAVQCLRMPLALRDKIGNAMAIDPPK
ncbi:trafficking protein Mon1-domain-containing protein, partial [Blyttiomyces helicus]